MHTNLPIILLLLTVVANFLIASVVFRKNPHSSTNISLSIFTLSIALWAIPNYMYAQHASYDEIVFWMRSVFFITGFMIASLTYFALVVPNKTLNRSIIFKVCFFIPSIMVGLMSYSNIIVESADILSSGTHIPVFGNGMLFYFAYVFVYIAIALFSLIKKYISSDNSRLKSQLMFVFLGLAILTIPASITNLIFVFIFKNTSYTTFGPVFSLLTFTLISYAIIRHRFLDIRVLFGRIAYYILITSIPYVFFFVLVFIYTNLFGTVFTPVVYLISIFVGVLYVLLFNWINQYLRTQITSRLINPGYDPVETTQQLSSRLSTIVDIEKITSDVLGTIQKTIRPANSGVYVSTSTDNLNLINFWSINSWQVSHLEKIFSASKSLWQAVGNHPIVLDEIDIEIQEGIYRNVPNLVKTIKLYLEQSSIKTVLVLGDANNPRGLLLIGQKEADSPYTTTDLNFLSSIAVAASAAIERSLLYVEVQQFAATLQIKVDNATTELQATNSNLEKTIIELQEARRKERDMIDVMGHELRTPISIVNNAIGFLKLQFEQHDGVIEKEILKKYISMAEESIHREITLIETLLSATKVDASRLQLHFTKVELNDVVEDGLMAHKNLADEKNLTISYTKPEKNISVFADRTRIQELMDNFMSNAIKYTPSGKIDISVWEKAGYGWISVKDTGIGISNEDLENIGKKFFRAKQYIPKSDTGEDLQQFIRPGGTGLGLYVVFNLVRIMNGKLYINSKVGEGSQFTFCLPLFKNQEDKHIDETFDKSSSDTPKDNSHVVINGQIP